MEGYEERKKARTNNWKAATTESRVLPGREQGSEGSKKEERETQPMSFMEVIWRRAEPSWSPGKEGGKEGKEGQVERRNPGPEKEGGVSENVKQGRNSPGGFWEPVYQ